jgi:hypothetical protein
LTQEAYHSAIRLLRNLEVLEEQNSKIAWTQTAND